MKKISLTVVLVLLIASASSAQIGGGARLAAMGNAGTALVSDISAAYYNPAGLMSAAHPIGFKLGVGAAVNGLNEVISTFSKITDLNTFMKDNLYNTVDVNGTTGALVGLQMGKIGLSVIPEGSLSASKAANTVNGTVTGALNYAVVLTLGTTLNTPFLPMSFTDVGMNIKYLLDYDSNTTISGVAPPATTGTAAYNETIGTGYGVDLGLRTGLELPVAPVAVGVVVKDLLETINNNTTARTDTVNVDGTYTKGAEVKSTSSRAVPSTLVLGAAAEMPVLGTVALDYSTCMGKGEIRFGLEQDLIPYLLKGRAGLISGTDTSKVTLGVGLLSNLNVAYLIDNRNSKDNVAVVDFSF